MSRPVPFWYWGRGLAFRGLSGASFPFSSLPDTRPIAADTAPVCFQLFKSWGWWSCRAQEAFAANLGVQTRQPTGAGAAATPKSMSGTSVLPWPLNGMSLAAGRPGARLLPPGAPSMVTCAPAIAARRTRRGTSPPSTRMPSPMAATPASPWWCCAAVATAGTAPTGSLPAAAAADPRGIPPVAGPLLAVTEVARWCGGFKNCHWPAIF